MGRVAWIIQMDSCKREAGKSESQRDVRTEAEVKDG